MIKSIRKAKKYFFIIFISSLSTVSAQKNIRFNHLTVDNGLSQNAVTCILQDHQGFMWFGTQDGLNRYDGYKYKIFKNDPDDTNSLTNNFIFSIYEDLENNLFVETQGGQYHKYNAYKESFSLIDTDSIDFSSSNFNSVGAILRDNNGVVWTGGLSKATGLVKNDPKLEEPVIFKHDPSNSKSLSNDKIYSIYRDKSGVLWIATFDGLNKLDERTGEFEHFRNDPNNKNSISDNWIWSIFEDSRGTLWIGTVRGGISQYDRNTNKFTNYSNDPADASSINSDFIFSIYEDKSSNIWLGTNSGGINYFHPASNSFEHYVHNPSSNSLSGNNVLSMFVDKKGNCWIGTRNAGLNFFDRTKNRFTVFKHNPNNSNSIIGNSIQLIYQDRDDILWLGTFSDGLDRYDPAKKQFRHFQHNSNDKSSISDNRVYAIYEDQKDVLWIGTYGGGLNRFDRKTNSFQHYQNDKDDSTTISADNVWAILEDRNNTFYVGTFGGGLNIFDRENESFIHFKNNPSDPESLSDNNVICLYEDSRGMVWIGTTSGLNKFDPSSGKFKSYREKQGLANDIVFGILEDNEGNLWISTNKGISKFDPITEQFKNFYLEDGLQSNEFNQNAYTINKNTGEMYFGGVNGFNIINPEKIQTNMYVPPLAFTEYTRYNTDDDQGRPIVEKGISSMENVELSYKDNIVTFEFSAFSYHNIGMNQYRYKLEGFNENWIQLGNENKVTFTNLSPDDYVLKIVGSNNDGIWNEQGTSISINVTPPWWRNNFAYAFYLFFILGSLYSIRRFEINRREQKSKLREAELSMKATEAEKRALKIENDRKSQELEEARQLQLSMLPKQLPEIPNIDIAVFMRTATEVGGDYYDFNVQEDGTLNIAFGDATGHGLQAGTMVTLMKGFFVSDSARLGIKEFMQHCSKLIKQIKIGRILMCFNFMKIKNNKMIFSSAAMPPIYLYNAESKKVEEMMMHGMPLGAIAEFPYEVCEKQLNSGDIILLLSDGLPEQMNSNEELFDYQKVKESFCESASLHPKEIISKLVTECDEWMGSEVQADDISLAVIKIK